MKIDESANQIVVRCSPSVKEWISFALFMFFVLFAFLFLLSFLVTDPTGFTQWIKRWIQAYIVFLIILVIIAVDIRELGAGFLTSHFQTRLTVNAEASSIDIFKRNILYGRTERFYFSQVIKFNARNELYIMEQPFFLELILVNHQTVRLERLTGERDEMTKLVKKLNKLLKPPRKPRKNEGV